jgi:hypothetical protein
MEEHFARAVSADRPPLFPPDGAASYICRNFELGVMFHSTSSVQYQACDLASCECHLECEGSRASRRITLPLPFSLLDVSSYHPPTPELQP